MTEKAWVELEKLREKVEAGRSSAYEIVASRYFLESIQEVRGSLSKAMELNEKHNKIYSRRARKPFVTDGKLQLPKIVHDKDGIDNLPKPEI